MLLLSVVQLTKRGGFYCEVVTENAKSLFIKNAFTYEDMLFSAFFFSLADQF